jgi:hypothetical protein
VAHPRRGADLLAAVAFVALERLRGRVSGEAVVQQPHLQKGTSAQMNTRVDHGYSS